jgi:hypothetical protein
MTYFYKIYRQHSHFFEESVTSQMDGPNELSWDQPVQVRMKFKRIADLLRDIYFTFRIPAIYSKFVDPAMRPSQYNFAWVRFLGCAAIRNAAIFVGGQKIQEFDGDYIIAKAMADYSAEKFYKFRQLVGDVSELTNPGLGLYGGGSETVGYPTVYRDTTAEGAQANRPSVLERDIHVPLPFWFTESPSQALPLISLQKHECEIQIQLRPIQELYTILDPSGATVRPGIRSVGGVGGQNPEYVAVTAQDTEIRQFMTDIDVTPPILNSWFFNPRIQGTYVYLTEQEQRKFAEGNLSYLVHQVNTFSYPAVYTRDYLDINAHNLLSRLLVLPRRTDSVQYRNDYANWTNWVRAGAVPYSPTPNIPVLSNFFYSSGRLIPNAQRNIIRGVRVICDGNELQEEKPADYFDLVVPWKYMDGGGEGASAHSGLVVYPFSLRSPGLQPSGSINSSRIRSLQVDVDVWPLAPDTNYIYDITVYAEAMNWFTITNGYGGLRYAL